MSRSCFVIGVGPGLGSSLARRFARAGYTLGLFARNGGYLSTLAADLGNSSAGFEVELTQPETLIAGLQAARAQLGLPEILIYNASCFREAGPFETSTQQLFEDLMVDLGGASIAVEALVPDMKARGRGTVLITGGGLALRPWAKATSLSVGKAAVRNYALCLAQSLVGTGVRAATITVDGVIARGTYLDPDAIADQFVVVSERTDLGWRPELVMRAVGE